MQSKIYVRRYISVTNKQKTGFITSFFLKLFFSFVFIPFHYSNLNFMSGSLVCWLWLEENSDSIYIKDVHAYRHKAR